MSAAPPNNIGVNNTIAKDQKNTLRARSLARIRTCKGSVISSDSGCILRLNIRAGIALSRLSQRDRNLPGVLTIVMQLSPDHHNYVDILSAEAFELERCPVAVPEIPKVSGFIESEAVTGCAFIADDRVVPEMKPDPGKKFSLGISSLVADRSSLPGRQRVSAWHFSDMAGRPDDVCC